MNYQKEGFTYIEESQKENHKISHSLEQGKRVQHNTTPEEKVEDNNREGFKNISTIPGFRSPVQMTISETNDAEQERLAQLEQLYNEELNNYRELTREYLEQYEENSIKDSRYINAIYRRYGRYRSQRYDGYVNRYGILMKSNQRLTNAKCGDSSNFRSISQDIPSSIRNLDGYSDYQTPERASVNKANYPCFLEGRNVRNIDTGDVGYINKRGRLTLWENNNTFNSTGTCPFGEPQPISNSDWEGLEKNNDEILHSSSSCDGLPFVNASLVERLVDSNNNLIQLASELNEETNKIYDIIDEMLFQREDARLALKSNLDEFERIHGDLNLNHSQRKIDTLDARVNDVQLQKGSNNLMFTMMLGGALVATLGAYKMLK